MKFEYYETEWGMNITMTPETPAECAEMLRISRNANSEKPNLYFDFSKDTPQLNMDIMKRKKAAQRNYIKPSTK